MTENQAFMVATHEISLFDFVDWMHGYEYKNKLHEIDAQIERLKQQQKELGSIYHKKYASEMNQIEEEADKVIQNGLNNSMKARKKR